nr:MAG TPA: hypothetical protein [Caudoviricetes sp.]
MLFLCLLLYSGISPRAIIIMIIALTLKSVLAAG